MPESPGWNWVSSIPQRVSLYDSTLKVLEPALARQPENELLQLRMLETLVALERFEEAIALGNRRSPGQTSSLFGSELWDGALAKALFALGRYDETLARISAALELEEVQDLLRLRIAALIKAKRLGEAASELELHRSSPNALLKGVIIELALSQWGPEEVLSHLEQRPNSFEPGDTAFARLRCLIKLGRSEEAAAMVDFDRHVRECIVEPPGGWEPGRYLDSLHDEVTGFDGLVPDPKLYSTRGGRQSFRPFTKSQAAISALIGQFRREVERYFAALPANDPISASRPANVEIEAWAVLLDQHGYQQPHFHPAAWLSGVYYIATPQTSSEAGALRIGLPPKSGEDMPWQVRHIAPEPGKLVLFPSFLWHDTVPHRGVLPRISIAFDIRPGPPQES
jgi:uncharacterized protein (TIGR02466 family)